MPLKPLVFLLFALVGFNTFSVSARTSIGVNATHGDKISSEVLIKNNKTAGTQEKGFFSRVKHKIASFIFKKQAEGEEKGSTKATLGWVSLGLIVMSFLLVGSSPLGGVTLLAGIVLGVVSLAMKKNETDIKKKKKSNLPAIIALSLVLAAVVSIVIILTAWGGGFH